MPLDLHQYVRPWQPDEEQGKQELLKSPIYSIYSERRMSPRTGDARPYYVIDCPDWVNVIPITPEGEVIMVAQWRHGTSCPTLEVPAGMLEPNETPEQGAARELREETGYVARKLTMIGSVLPNPAIQSNRCATVLAEDVTFDGPVALDPGEDIAVLRLPLDEVLTLIADGTIEHSLVVAAFFWLQLHRSKQ